MRGKAAVKVASACLFAAAVLVLILLVVVLNRVILDPAGARDAARGGNRGGRRCHAARSAACRRNRRVGTRVRPHGRSASPSRVCSSSISPSRRGSRSSPRGVLHNLGNAMTPDRRAAGESRRAIAQRPGRGCGAGRRRAAGAAAATSQRKADLEEFLRLACKELAVTVRAAQEDVTVMTPPDDRGADARSSSRCARRATNM